MRLAVGLAFAATGLLLSRLPAHSASAAICDTYAKEAASKAQGVRDFGCGYDLKDPRWITSRKSHSDWCRASPVKTVADETARRRGEMNLCQTCRVYADMAVEAAVENKKLNCRLSGSSWNESKSDHFAWCMALRDEESTGVPDLAARYQSIATKIETKTREETLARRLQLMKCETLVLPPQGSRPQ
jgi:hypothetical protein